MESSHQEAEHHVAAMSDLKYWNCEGAQLYAVSSIPHTVLIDGEGTILSRGLHGDELQEKIAEAVK